MTKHDCLAKLVAEIGERNGLDLTLDAPIFEELLGVEQTDPPLNSPKSGPSTPTVDAAHPPNLSKDQPPTAALSIPPAAPPRERNDQNEWADQNPTGGVIEEEPPT